MKHRPSTRFLLLLVLMIAPAAAHAQAWFGIINTPRATDWSTAGIPGGIPSGSWTQCGSTIAAYGTSGTPASPALINGALNHTGAGYTSCGANTYVLLGPGNFYLNSTIDFGHTSNVVLRGSGANSTFLHFSNVSGCTGLPASICITGSSSSRFGGSTDVNWTAGYAQNSSTITLSGASPIIVGLTPIILDQCQTGYTGNSSDNTCTGAATDNGQFYVCDQPGASQGGLGAPWASSGRGAGCDTELQAATYWPLRSQEEVVIVTQCDGNSTVGHACSSGSNMTISPGLRSPNWASGLSPKAHIPGTTITNSGVENLYLDNQATGNPGVVMVTAYKTWVKGVASHYGGNLAHVVMFWTSHSVVRDSYFYWTFTIGDKSYGVTEFDAGDLLVENNIFQGVAAPISIDGPCSGCVYAYNFAVNNLYGNNTYMSAMVAVHSSGTNQQLYEGNIGSGLSADNIHGSHDMLTVFRNFFNGMEADGGRICTTGAAGSCFNHQAIDLKYGSRYFNIVGNVLGTANYHTVRQCVGPPSISPFTCANQTFSVYNLGYGGGTGGESDFANTPPVPNDALVPSTLFRWGNVESYNNTTTAGFNSGDVPTTDSFYPNVLPASNNLPASFYNGVTTAHASCGTGLSFWKNPTTGTCPPYPPIGPDVTGGVMYRFTSGTYNWARVLPASTYFGSGTAVADEAGFANANPAMVCYLNQMAGTPDGTGSMLTFNPSACYAADSGGVVSQPAPPTSLIATVE
jgi:hypothetical protein